MFFTKPIIASLFLVILIVSVVSTLQFSHTGKVITSSKNTERATTSIEKSTSMSSTTSISLTQEVKSTSTTSKVSSSSSIPERISSISSSSSSSTSSSTSTTSTIKGSESSESSKSETDHVMINEIQVSPNEFIELYNPTDNNVDMSGWYLCYFSSKKDWNEPYRKWRFENGSIIQAHGYYLINVYDSTSPDPDWTLLTKKKTPYSIGQLSNSNGSVALFPFNPKEKSAEEAKSGRIDAVGWGNPSHVFEETPCSTPPKGKSLERKSCSDTDKNSFDFIITSPNPKNSE